MALMMGKYLEIKMGRSLRQIRQDLWRGHEAQIRDERTGETYVLRMDVGELESSELMKLLNSDFPQLIGRTQDFLVDTYPNRPALICPRSVDILSILRNLGSW